MYVCGMQGCDLMLNRRHTVTSKKQNNVFLPNNVALESMIHFSAFSHHEQSFLICGFGNSS